MYHVLPVTTALPQLLIENFRHFPLKLSWPSRPHQVPLLLLPCHHATSFHYTWVCNVLFVSETISLVLTALVAFWSMRLDPFFAYPNKTRWVSHTRHSVNTCWIHGRFHFLFSSIIHTFITVKAKNKNKNGLTCLKITLPQIAREN